MKMLHRPLLFVAVSMWSLLAFLPGSRADEAADHDSLRQMKTVYEDALNKGDLGPLRGLPASNFSGVLLLGEEVHNYDELVANWKRLQDLIGKGGQYHVKINPQLSDLYGDIAVSHGTNEEYVRTGDGREYRFPSSWTVVSHRENGQWKVVRMHASMAPVVNVFSEAKLMAARVIYGIGGVVAGLLLMGVLRMFSSRRKAAQVVRAD